MDVSQKVNNPSPSLAKRDLGRFALIFDILEFQISLTPFIKWGISMDVFSKDEKSSKPLLKKG